MIDTSDINATNPADVQIAHGTLQNSFDVCADERFATQPTAAGCSGTLIGPDLILTAGHCINSSGCSGTSFVFDWTMTDATTLHTITTDDVYACQSVVARTQNNSLDFSVVRLDRPVVGRTPAQLAYGGAALPDRTTLIVQGYPTTIPLKIDDGGAVRDGRPDQTDFFVANLDTFGGNSGSGVFMDNGLLVGILVRGDSDYVTDGTCERVHVCEEDGCGGEESTYAFRAITALCAATDEPVLCDCGDTTCDAGIGETTASCPTDCGTACGDGVCNGGETPTTCSDDCGTCGNGACDGGETEDTCCEDCACSGADEPFCYHHACIADPTAADTCANAEEIATSGTMTYTGSTSLAQDDLSPSMGCADGAGGDRVYTFTLDATAHLDAEVQGFDTILYVQAMCGDATTELACNDDIDTQSGEYGSEISLSLTPGTYALVVDGYDANGDYELTVTFSGGGPDAGPDGGGGDGGCCSTSGGDPAGAGVLVLIALIARRRRARAR